MRFKNTTFQDRYGLLSQASVLVFSAALSVATTAEAAGSQPYNIPAGSLASALNQVAETGGWQLVYDSAITQGLQSQGLRGTYMPETALQQLLSNSGLSYRIAENGNVLIERQQLNYKQDPAALPAVNVVGNRQYDRNDPYSQLYSAPNAITATKTDIAIMDTPVSIQVVPKSIMNDQQAIRIEDAIVNNVSGVQRAYGTADMYESFIIRGFDSGEQMYRNGFRRSMGKYDPSNIEQIEVLKGPASVLYGRLQPGGMINYVTKQALDQPYYALQQQFGSFGEFRTTVDATGPLDKEKTLLYRFNGAYDEGESYRDFVDHERVFIAPKLTWRPNDRFESNVEIEKRHENYTEDYGVPVLGNRPVTNRRNLFTGDPNFKSSQDTTLAYADWSYKFNNDWAVKHKFQWDETDIVFGGVGPTDRLNPDGHTMDRFTLTGTGNRRSYSTSVDLTGKFETYGLKHNVLLGGDYYFFNQDLPDNKFGSDSWYGHTINSGFDINNPQYGVIDLAALNAIPANFIYQEREDWFGVYFQDQITLWDTLHIMGGGRYDMASYGSNSAASWEETKAGLVMQHENKFSPRVGILYQPWDWLSLYGNYVESFGTNNGRNAATGGSFAPQGSEQYEIGFKTEFFDKRLSSTVSYYHLTKNNLKTYDLSTPNPTDEVAIGEARSQGIEIDIKGQVTDQFSLVTTYAFTDARVTKDTRGFEGTRLINVPEHQASLWGTYQFTEHFKAGLGGVVVGKREGDTANTYQLPGYTRLDAMAAYIQPIGKTRLTAQINVYNLLDKEYFPGSTNWLPTANVGAPLSAMGSLKLEY